MISHDWVTARPDNPAKDVSAGELNRHVTPAWLALPESNGVDDTAVIQAALDAARLTFAPSLVKGLPGENYLITTIRVGSYTTLDMTGCKVTQIAGTDTNMLQNYAVQFARTVMDANITAGTTTLTSATADFQAGEDENNVRIWGAGPGGEVFQNTIASITNSTTVELYTAAVTTVTNGQATVRQWDKEILVRGGLWDRGDNGRLHQYEPGHEGDEDFRIQDASGFAMLFRRCAYVTVQDVKFYGTNADQCSALCFGDATQFVAENISTDYFVSGLIQITGPSRHGRFTNIYGRCTDDLLAILPVDWLTGVRDVWGDCAFITLDNIHSEACDGSLVVVAPGSSSLNVSCKHIYIHNVYGLATNFTQQRGGLVQLGDLVGYPDVVGGWFDDIVVANVAGESTGDYDASRGLVFLCSPNAGRIHLSDINVDAPTGFVQHGIVIAPDTDIGYLTVTDSVVGSVDGGARLIDYSIATDTTIQNVAFDRNALRVNGAWTLLPSAYSAAVLSVPDLLLYWRLSEAAGPTIYDISGNGYHGTAFGSPSFGTPGLLTSDHDRSWTGNGTDSGINGPTIPAQAEWSISFWAKQNTGGTDFDAYFATPGDRFDIAWLTNSGGTLFFEDGGGWIGTSQVGAGSFWVWTFDATNGLTVWKDATNVYQNAAKGRSLLNAAFVLGAFPTTWTVDTLDEFAIYSRALTQTEVTGLYRAR